MSFSVLTASLLAGLGAANIPALRFDEALAQARQHSPAELAALAEVASAKLRVEEPRARWLPSLGAAAQFIVGTVNNTSAEVLGTDAIALPRIGGRAYDPTASFGSSATYQPYASTVAGVGVSQQLWDFGFTAAEIATARAQLAATTQNARQSALDVDDAVTAAFVGVLGAHDVERAVLEAVARARTFRAQAEAMVLGELRSRIDLDRADAQLAQLEAAHERALAGVTAAQAALAAAVGFEGPLLEASGPGPDHGPLPGNEAALARAESASPEIAAASARLEAQQQLANASEARLLPRLDLTGAFSARSGGAPVTGDPTPRFGGFLPETPNWDLGITLNWNLLDPVLIAEARAAQSREAIERARVEEIRQRIRAATERAWAQADAAEKVLPALARALSSAHANYDQAAARFKEGLGTSVDVADAQSLLTNADAALAEGTFEVARARAALDRLLAGGN